MRRRVTFAPPASGYSLSGISWQRVTVPSRAVRAEPDKEARDRMVHEQPHTKADRMPGRNDES